MLTRACEPALDVTAEAFHRLAAEDDHSRAVIHQLLRGGDVIPPLQTMNAPISKVRQRNRKAATSAGRLRFSESEVVFECARQFDECHPARERWDTTDRSYSYPCRSSKGI